MSQEKKWMDKIEKLLAKANRAGSQEEADTFYAKAQELMAKWSIDEAMLQKSGKSQDELITEHVEMKRSGLFRTFVDLWSQVARNNDVKILIYSPSKFRSPGVDLIGWKSDVEKVKMLVSSLMIHSQRERNNAVPEWMKLEDGWSNSAEVARFRKSFMVGYSNRIGQRLATARRQVQQEATEADTGSGVALAIRDRSAAVQDYFDAIPKGKARRSQMRIDSAGYGSGQEAAEKADLGQDQLRKRDRLDG